jgi:hypothetical protein
MSSPLTSSRRTGDASVPAARTETSAPAADVSPIAPDATGGLTDTDSLGTSPPNTTAVATSPHAFLEALTATRDVLTQQAPTAPLAKLWKDMPNMEAFAHEIGQLQQCLNYLGFHTASPGEDGFGTFGPKTQAALQRFQVRYGIAGADGSYGDRTRIKLAEVLKGGPINTGAHQIEAPFFAQTDPRWSWMPYVFQPSTTLGTVGCTLTTLTMAAGWASGNPKFTPAYVNTSGSNYGEALAQFSERHLGDEIGHPVMWLNEQGPGFDIIRPGTADFENLLEAVRASIRRGEPVALGFKIDLGQWGRHSTLATGVREDGMIMLNDAATGRLRPLSDFLSHPGFEGFDLADAIIP